MSPSSQYDSDTNLRSRQRLWDLQQPRFEIVDWALELVGLHSGSGAEVLDVGCGNGSYLAELRSRGIAAVGCDLSAGMLAAARPHLGLVNADAQALPLRSDRFDVVLVPHMLYLVPDRRLAASEFRRVLRPGGTCLVVTNGRRHAAELDRLIEDAVSVAQPGWRMPTRSSHAFSLENGAAQLRDAYSTVALAEPTDLAPVIVEDADVIGD